MQTATSNDLNLARKWRPQSFDSIVGQEIPVRMLKNSIFLKKFFPVYLFAGQRGCGKTTTARILAAAANCAALELFQADPKNNPLPCLQCQSCLTMAQGSHPDFIEIDAASNTGVDNIRQLIETAAYVPLGGNKKVFLIDEAHMLSKAAFNAFLKLLEEPPRSVLFILATTELHKIPQTVLSRCFQVIFSAIEENSLRTHLTTMCVAEQIQIEQDALDIIIQESDGSARDAINLLEQVRFAHDAITAQNVLESIGKLSNEALYTIVAHIIDKNPTELLVQLTTLNIERLNAEAIWQSLTDSCKALLWLKYDSPSIPHSLQSLHSKLRELAKQCTLNRLHAMMQLLWSQEMQFLRTSKKHAFLEIVLIQLCTQTDNATLHDGLKTSQEEKKNSGSGSGPIQRASTTKAPTTPQTPPLKSVKDETVIHTEKKVLPSNNEQSLPAATGHSPHNAQWEQFKGALTTSNQDPMVTTILQQAQLVGIAEDRSVLILRLNRNSKFLRDSVESARHSWLPLLLQYFTEIATVEFIDTPEAQPGPVARFNPTINAPTHTEKKQDTSSFNQPMPGNNPSEWPVATTLKKYIPGKIKKSHLLN